MDEFLRLVADRVDDAAWKEMATIGGQSIPEDGIDRVRDALPEALAGLRVDAQGSWLIFGKRLYAASIASMTLAHEHVDHILSDDLVCVQFIIDGAFEFSLEHGGRYSLSSGRGVVLICPAGTRLRRHMHPGPAVQYIGITMSIAQLERDFGVAASSLRAELRAVAEGRLHHPVALEFHITQEQRQAAAALLDPARTGFTGRLATIYVEAKLTELACLSLGWLLTAGPSGRKLPCLQDRTSQALERAAMMMAADPGRQPSIRELCRIVGVNRNKLAAGFRDRFGLTPCGYGRRLRLHRAAELMSTSTMSVFEVSHEMGFASQSSFARAFKEEFGHSPVAHRALGPAAGG